MPLANASPRLAPSSDATHVSSAARVGLPVRPYSNPACLPTASWANVVARLIGVTTAPVTGSGSWPAWMARGLEARALGHRTALAARNASTSERLSRPTG